MENIFLGNFFNADGVIKKYFRQQKFATLINSVIPVRHIVQLQIKLCTIPCLKFFILLSDRKGKSTCI